MNKAEPKIGAAHHGIFHVFDNRVYDSKVENRRDSADDQIDHMIQWKGQHYSIIVGYLENLLTMGDRGERKMRGNSNYPFSRLI